MLNKLNIIQSIDLHKLLFRHPTKALEVCPLTKTDHRSLDFVVMRFLIKLFCTSNSDIVNECRVYFGFKLPSEIVPTRTDKFMSKLSM